MNFPCKDCNDRNVGCHGTCEKYKVAKEKHKDEIEKGRRDDIAYKTEVRSRGNTWFSNFKKRR